MGAVEATVNYLAPMAERPRYHAQNHDRDNLVLDPRKVAISDARAAACVLERDGFALLPHRSAVADFRDEAEVARVHAREIAELVRDATGADKVVVTGKGILRFGERSPLSGKLFNSQPARFIHIDVSDATARAFAERSNPEPRRSPHRFLHCNVWRALSPPPQDVPLALCASPSVAPEDLIAADAVFDADAEWSFEGLLVRYSARHRWWHFPDMRRDEALIFKTNDSAGPAGVPHSAFDDPACPAGTPPRESIEMRAIAYWY